ncbi:MAG: hypothetical protein WC314_22365 [Vulcanimicrobiota bacterium]
MKKKREVEKLREELMRPAVLFEPAVEELADEPGSYFGGVTVAAQGEGWPDWEGQPMVPLLQLNLSELVYRPPGSEDVRLLSLFVAPEGKQGWSLRTYSTLSVLQRLEAPELAGATPAVRLGPPVLVEDYPPRGRVEVEFFERFPNQEGLKLGGWPSSDPVDSLQHVLQVNSIGVYLSRRGKEWFLDWRG